MEAQVREAAWRLGILGLLVAALFMEGCAKAKPKEIQRTVPNAPATFQVRENVLAPPPVGIYHGAFPDIPTDSRSTISSSIAAMERLAEKSLAWVQYENDWAKSQEFPWAVVQSIAEQKKVPYIRILPRSTSEQNQGADPVYTLDNFLLGYFDDTIEQWARLAKASGVRLVVEFAPEVNGNWYPWNGQWNGGAEAAGYGDPKLADGPERFRDVYRRVIDIFRRVGSDQITWIFHVDSQPQPTEAWNAMANYYPGDSYIDWIGVSAFGAQRPEDYWESFTNVLDGTYNELVAISPMKPVAIVEFGVIERPGDPTAKPRWIQEALDSLKNGWFPHVKAISYWHERAYGMSPARSLRIDSSLGSLGAYKAGVATDYFLGEAKFTTAAQAGEAR
jgi:hypothetical protein